MEDNILNQEVMTPVNEDELFVIVNNNDIKIVNSEGNNSLIEKVLDVVKETISSKK